MGRGGGSPVCPDRSLFHFKMLMRQSCQYSVYPLNIILKPFRTFPKIADMFSYGPEGRGICKDLDPTNPMPALIPYRGASWAPMAHPSSLCNPDKQLFPSYPSGLATCTGYTQEGKHEEDSHVGLGSRVRTSWPGNWFLGNLGNML